MATNGPPAIPGSRASRRRRIGLASLAIVAVVVLRHDFWQWTEVRPLLFGILPAGLWWQAGVAVLASLAMALTVRLAWPAALEQAADEQPGTAPEPQPSDVPRR